MYSNVHLSPGEIPQRQPGFDFIPFDFEATRRGVESAMSKLALQVSQDSFAF